MKEKRKKDRRGKMRRTKKVRKLLVNVSIFGTNQSYV